MIIELKKYRGVYSTGKKFEHRLEGICSRFVRKKLGTTKNVDKIKVYVRFKDPKNKEFDKAVFEKKWDSTKVKINNSRFGIYYYTQRWLEKNVGDNPFWFKIKKA